MRKLSFLFWLSDDAGRKYRVTVETERNFGPGVYCGNFFQDVITDDRSLVLLSEYKSGSKQDLAEIVAPSSPRDRWSVMSAAALR